MRDYGFDLDDVRHEFWTPDEQRVRVRIVRHWYAPDGDEDDEPQYRVSWDITKGAEVTRLPIGTREEAAIDIAHTLYEQDDELTAGSREVDAEIAAERRMGA